MVGSQTREALIAAAAALIDVGGREAVTLRAVAERVGVSHNAPYKHFSGKDALLATVAARELQRLATELGAAAVAETGAFSSLERVVAGYLGWALDHPHRFRLTFGPWQVEHSELEAAAQRAQAGLVNAVGRALEESGSGTERAVRMAALLHATLHGAVDLTLNQHLGGDAKAGVDAKQVALDLLTMAFAGNQSAHQRQ